MLTSEENDENVAEAITCVQAMTHEPWFPTVPRRSWSAKIESVSEAAGSSAGTGEAMVKNTSIASDDAREGRVCTEIRAAVVAEEQSTCRACARSVGFGEVVLSGW